MKLLHSLALAAMATLPAVSMAAVDVTDVVTDIDGAAAPIALIGGAVLAILVGIKIYKWIRRAM